MSPEEQRWIKEAMAMDALPGGVVPLADCLLCSSISMGQARRLAAAGKLNAFKVNGRWLARITGLERWAIERQKRFDSGDGVC